MPRTVELSDEKRGIILDAYARGCSIRTIGKVTNIGDTAIMRTLTDADVEIVTRGASDVDHVRNQQIVNMRNAGTPLKDIATKFGLSTQRVHFIASRGY